MRGDVKGGLKELKVFVEGAEQFVNTTSQPDGLFHQVSRKRYLQDKKFNPATISVARDENRVKAGAQDSSYCNNG